MPPFSALISGTIKVNSVFHHQATKSWGFRVHWLVGSARNRQWQPAGSAHRAGCLLYQTPPSYSKFLPLLVLFNNSGNNPGTCWTTRVSRRWKPVNRTKFTEPHTELSEGNSCFRYKLNTSPSKISWIKHRFSQSQTVRIIVAFAELPKKNLSWGNL